jgi:hypothetical protein
LIFAFSIGDVNGGYAKCEIKIKILGSLKICVPSFGISLSSPLKWIKIKKKKT